MRIVFTSYVHSPEFAMPTEWLNRIEGYIGILESLSRKHEVISIEQINFEGRYVNNGVDYRFIKSSSTIFPLALHTYIKKLNPEVVFVHGMHFPIQVIQLRRKLGKNVKLFLQNHAEKPAAGWKRLFQMLADKGVTGYFFTSKEMGEPWIQKKIISNSGKVHQVMEASSAFRQRNRELARKITGVDGDPVFLWVGRLDANKDPLTVVHAFTKFLPHQPTAKLYMLFHTEELKEQVSHAIEFFRNNIILVGKIPHERLEAWFNSAEFIVSGSHYEGGGIAVCEGMSCGCIPLLTNIASFRMMTNQGKCGDLYTPGSVDELLSVLLKTKELNIQNEREKVIQQFETSLSFDAIAEKISQVIVSS
jgi:glycosyltransferase involved in cell wall biosynthesis